MRVRVSVPAERKMTLYLLHSLFVYVFKFALSVNSSTKHNCVNTAWNPKNCTVLSGPGTFCVNRTLNPTLCKGQPPLQLIKGPINDSDESFYKPPTPKYPLPASENTLYLVGYSRPLNKSEYSCVASTFNKMAGGFIHRTLFLKRAPTPVKYWDTQIPLQIQATMCYMTMNLTLTCPLIKLGAKEQYLMFLQTWNWMLLTELIDIREQPLCSIWAKNKYAKKDKVDPYTVALFRAICKDAVYDGYPDYCPKHEK
ncbi:japanin-like-RA2 isoform X2 [Rhipicephalus microplus]|uniref:japanin-like-RA2 isoform X2 n=1 Tax=Rhipicephalus microplus TaxID=6941 RepID=UPI003F6B0CE3